MNIDKFGRSMIRGANSHQAMSLKPQGFPRTSDGNYDVENLRLQNLAAPLLPKDASSKQYVDELVEKIEHQQDSLRERVRKLEEMAEKLTESSPRLQQRIARIEKAVNELPTRAPTTLNTDNEIIVNPTSPPNYL